MTGTDQARAVRAFTLIEMMVVVAILGIVMGMVTVALNSASDETSLNTGEAAMQTTTNVFAQRLVAELRNARHDSDPAQINRRVRINADGSQISFQVPIDEDGDNLADIDANGNPVFGATLSGVHTPGADIVYEFRANQVGGGDEKLSESQLGVDLNGDGDEMDEYRRGLFTRTAADGSGNELPRACSDRWFLFGDEGLGYETPIFQWTADGTTIKIRLLAAEAMERLDTPVRSLVVTSVRPFNTFSD